MDFSVYQSATNVTAIYPAEGALYYVTMGLASESGEVAGKVKKALRDDNGVISDERRKAILDEVGDVLWYCARIAEELGVDLNDVAKGNLEKLMRRKTAGKIGGDGDDR
jgi:NTP pyrophosphatase (non-canonical NTP hydrolase)